MPAAVHAGPSKTTSVVADEPTPEEPIRVLIADDHPIIRQGLAAIIDRQADMIVVAQSANGEEAVTDYRTLQPDVVLMDLRMPVRDGVEAIEAIRDEFPAARIVVLTTFHTEEDIYKGLRAGAMSYLVKGVPTEELLTTIRAAFDGKKRILPDIATKLTERMSSPELTARELEVLSLLVDGNSNKEIAAVLGIGEGTVRIHCNNLFHKLSVNDRTQAVTVALRRGIVRLDSSN